MTPFKFFVQDRYGTTYRIYCGYEAPVLGPIRPQHLSTEHDAHEFIIRLRLDHAFCLNLFGFIPRPLGRKKQTSRIPVEYPAFERNEKVERSLSERACPGDFYYPASGG